MFTLKEVKAKKDMCYLAIPRSMGVMYKAENLKLNTKFTMRNIFHIKEGHFS